jgi:Leucine-rich repeat (LRR) protein
VASGQTNKVNETLQAKCEFSKGKTFCDDVKIVRGQKSKITLKGGKKEMIDVGEVIFLNKESENMALKDFRLELFKAFPKISSLRVSNYTIPSVTLTDNVMDMQLVSLTIRTAGLESFKSELSNNSFSLEDLCLEINELASIHKRTFRGLTQLTSLDLYQNKIQSIHPEAFKAMKSLAKLSLSRNPIKQISLTFFQALPTSVTTLFMQGNRIKVLPFGCFQTFPKFLVLSLVNNNITTFNAQYLGLTECVFLGLDRNKLEDFNVTGVKSLRILNVEDNKLKKISNDLFDKDFVAENLWFRKNRISEIERDFMERQPLMKTAQYSLNPCVSPGPTENRKMMMENMAECFNNFKASNDKN